MRSEEQTDELTDLALDLLQRVKAIESTLGRLDAIEARLGQVEEFAVLVRRTPELSHALGRHETWLKQQAIERRDREEEREAWAEAEPTRIKLFGQWADECVLATHQNDRHPSDVFLRSYLTWLEDNAIDSLHRMDRGAFEEKLYDRFDGPVIARSKLGGRVDGLDGYNLKSVVEAEEARLAQRQGGQAAAWSSAGAA